MVFLTEKLQALGKNRNPTLLSLVPERNMQASEPIVDGLIHVEGSGVQLATLATMNAKAPRHALASLLYAAALVATYEDGEVPANCVDLFSHLPIRDYEVIGLGNHLHDLPLNQQAAIFAREAMKLIVQQNVKPTE